jgi:hypothetical protein
MNKDLLALWFGGREKDVLAEIAKAERGETFAKETSAGSMAGREKAESSVLSYHSSA